MLKLGIIANILIVVDLEQNVPSWLPRQIDHIARWLISGFYPSQKNKTLLKALRNKSRSGKRFSLIELGRALLSNKTQITKIENRTDII